MRDVIAIGHSSGHLELVDVHSGETLIKQQVQHKPVHCVALSSDGFLVACGAGCQWEIRTASTFEERLYNRGHSGTGGCICEGGLNTECGSGGRRPDPGCPAPGHYGTIEAIAFSRCGRRLATGARDGLVIVWETMHGTALRCMQPIPGQERDVDTVLLAGDGTRLLCSTWVMMAGSAFTKAPAQRNSRGARVAFVELDVQSGEVLGRAARVSCLAVAPDESAVVFAASSAWFAESDVLTVTARTPRWLASIDGQVREEGRGAGPRATLRLEAQARVSQAAFASGGRAVVFGDGEGRVHCWDLSTGARRELAGARWCDDALCPPLGGRGPRALAVRALESAAGERALVVVGVGGGRAECRVLDLAQRGASPRLLPQVRSMAGRGKGLALAAGRARDWAEEARLAWAMAQHPRLGAAAGAHALGVEPGIPLLVARLVAQGLPGLAAGGEGSC